MQDDNVCASNKWESGMIEEMHWALYTLHTILMQAVASKDLFSNIPYIPSANNSSGIPPIAGLIVFEHVWLPDILGQTCHGLHAATMQWLQHHMDTVLVRNHVENCVVHVSQ